MTAESGVTSPDVLTGAVLALPAGASLDGLARAWYPEAAWTRAPVSAETASARSAPLRGARFRGMTASAEAEPGELELEPGLTLSGPHPLSPGEVADLGLTLQRASAYVVASHGADQLQAARLQRWLVAAARTSRGAVRVRGGAPLVPDPTRSVDRQLFSAHALAPGHALALVRTVLVQATLQGAPAGPPAGSTPVQSYAIVTRTPYDGTVTLTCTRAERLPYALRTLDWRESGPFSYAVTWEPEGEAEDTSEHPSQLLMIARNRMAPVVAAVVSVLHEAIAGTVLDSDGFICTDVVRRRA